MLSQYPTREIGLEGETKNGNQEHQESSQQPKQQPSPPSINKTEMLEMRRWMVGIVEELKMKRKGVVEAETRSDSLEEQLHSLQVQKDAEQQSARQREEQLERSLAAVKQQCEDKIKAVEIEKMSCHQKEKLVRELETQLQSERAASGKLLTQWKKLDIKFQDLTRLYKICQQSLNRLDEGGEYVSQQPIAR
ncbi:hypothetical protein PoB_003234100 [Plakobranchus ocellatus]|uniref:Uncharacterized protein n=1 Tax=Plakobranchus ocellatus TaxID=259542 RepID=A0AAV4AGT8_9GAST|nr:hypothetical protein PoB_003234100 [Plakobranchus ocellatus]